MHSVHTRAAARTVGWSCALLRTAAPALSRPKAQVVTPNLNRPGHDLKSMSGPASVLPTETPMSRPKTLVATPNHHKAARIMSRHQIGVATSLRPLQVATLKRGRDTVSPAQPQARSQHQNQVATLLETNLCRDINFMSRPHLCQNWDFQVATPKFQVATSKMMSRPQFHPAKSQPQIFQVTTPKAIPRRDLKSMSRRRFCPIRTNDVATS